MSWSNICWFASQHWLVPIKITFPVYHTKPRFYLVVNALTLSSTKQCTTIFSDGGWVEQLPNKNSSTGQSDRKSEKKIMQCPALGDTVKYSSSKSILISWHWSREVVNHRRSETGLWSDSGIDWSVQFFWPCSMIRMMVMSTRRILVVGPFSYCKTRLQISCVASSMRDVKSTAYRCQERESRQSKHRLLS